MVLIRCTVETTEATVAKSCSESLVALQTRLREVGERSGWDLGEAFLRQCEEPISRLMANDSGQLAQDNTGRQGRDNLDTRAGPSGRHNESLGCNGDMADPFDPISGTSMDLPMGHPCYPFDTLWNMFDYIEVPGQIS